MTKAEVVSEISRQTGLDKADVLAVVESLMEVIKDTLANGENVYFRGFGSFIVKTRAEKIGRNITKGTSVVIPEHKIPALRPAPAFTEMLNK